jgi:hypothetical protein
MGPRCRGTITRQRGDRAARQDAATGGVGAVAQRVHDEALWRRPDEIERIARDERQGIGLQRAQDGQIRRLDNLRVTDEVVEVAARRLHGQAIADADVFQRPEQPVAMRGYGAIARLPGERRVGQMADGHLERLLIVARHDGCQQVEARDVQQREHFVRRARQATRTFEGLPRPIRLGGLRDLDVCARGVRGRGDSDMLRLELLDRAALKHRGGHSRVAVVAQARHPDQDEQALEPRQPAWATHCAPPGVEPAFGAT